jgi:hypothetical protein
MYQAIKERKLHAIGSENKWLQDQLAKTETEPVYTNLVILNHVTKFPSMETISQGNENYTTEKK